MKQTTLNDVCNKLIEYSLYDFQEPLQVCYKMQDSHIFGYCHIMKKMSGFSIDYRDGDAYSMSDEILSWEFDGDKVGTLILEVWVSKEFVKENK